MVAARSRSVRGEPDGASPLLGGLQVIFGVGPGSEDLCNANCEVLPSSDLAAERTRHGAREGAAGAQGVIQAGVAGQRGRGRRAAQGVNASELVALLGREALVLREELGNAAHAGVACVRCWVQRGSVAVSGGRRALQQGHPEWAGKRRQRDSRSGLPAGCDGASGMVAGARSGQSGSRSLFTQNLHVPRRES